MLKLTNIYIYPVKSLAGIALQESETEERGLKYDRRWILVNDQGEFMSQRKHPKMALLIPAFENGNLLISAPDLSAIEISLENKSDDITPVNVWGTDCKGYVVSDAHNQWFSEQLDTNCKLVFMGDQKRDIKSLTNEGEVSYADGYPYLIVGQSSLEDLNERLDEPVSINRFRPNLVFSKALPFEEDSWGDFKIGNVEFHGVKPCARCVMTTINQRTGEKGKEPLKTLATFRQRDNKIYFGLNAVLKNAGMIKVGDVLAVAGSD